MTRDKKGGLSHHEELRYFYLLRNLSYLSDNEKIEYRYLKAKMDAVTSDYQAGFEQDRDYKSSSYGSNYQVYQPGYSENLYEGSNPDDLPLYPQEEHLSRKERRSRKKRQQEYEQSQDFYEEDFYDKKAKKAPRKKRGLSFYLKIVGFLLFLLLVGILIMFFKGFFDVSHNAKNYKPAVSETFKGQDTKDGTNILVLGSDKRVTQGSNEARTDTIMVVNMGNKDKKVKMVSFMRDTLVNIPGYSANNSSYDLKLNASFNLGEQANNQGAELVRKTLKHNYDIDIKYYVMVDFETFSEAIDTLFPNGVEMDAKFATIGGEAVDSVEVPDDLRMKDGIVPDQTIKVGKQRMDGRTLLNYARFRKDDEGDYGRTVRQQQVMSAVMSQIKDPSKLFTGSAAIGKIYALTSTNLSFPFVAQKGLTTLTAGKGVEHITIPQNGDWIDEYDMYGGQALYVDFDKYQEKLSKLGLR